MKILTWFKKLWAEHKARQAKDAAEDEKFAYKGR